MLGSGDVFVTGPAATIDDVRPRCKRFRILVMGVRNAGKTTILQRMCNTNGDPVVRDKHGRKIDSAILEPSTERGISDIEHEITFPSNPGFVFHDSRGIEAGSASELNIVEHFIASRAVCRNLEDQLHTIWYCLPVSGARPLSDAEMKFFEHGTGAVPVIAIFTKFEGQILLARQKLRRDGVPLAEAKVQAIDLANRNFQDNLLKRVMSTKYPPLYYVCFQELHKKDADCSELTQKTADALSDNILQQLFAVVQQNNIQVSIKGGLRGIMESIGRFQDDFYIIRHLFLFILPWVVSLSV